MESSQQPSRSRLAAEHKHATGCSFMEAARRFDLANSGSTRREYLKLYHGVARKSDLAKRVLPAEVSVRVERAVTYAANHGTTLRKAARVFSVDAQDVCDAWNKRFKARRMLVGPSGLTVVWR